MENIEYKAENGQLVVVKTISKQEEQRFTVFELERKIENAEEEMSRIQSSIIEWQSLIDKAQEIDVESSLQETEEGGE